MEFLSSSDKVCQNCVGRNCVIQLVVLSLMTLNLKRPYRLVFQSKAVLYSILHYCLLVPLKLSMHTLVDLTECSQVSLLKCWVFTYLWNYPYFSVEGSKFICSLLSCPTFCWIVFPIQSFIVRWLVIGIIEVSETCWLVLCSF